MSPHAPHDHAQKSPQGLSSPPARASATAQWMTMDENLILFREESEDERARPTINTLPDDGLLEIFRLYVDDMNAWPTLVHVCRRWRNLVFASPRHLNLRLVCTSRTRVRELLGVWPALPIDIEAYSFLVDDVDNIFAALEHPDRLRRISLLQFPGLVLLATPLMHIPFPHLTVLHLEVCDDQVGPVLPDSFLGGSSPRLRSLYLGGIPYPAVQSLLLSASHLDHLSLMDIPQSGYISPEAMVTCLSQLAKLENLSLSFRSPRSPPDQSSPPPPTRAVFPALVGLHLKGVHEYVEDFLARFDAPLLSRFSAYLPTNPVIDFQQLHHFIGRTETLKPIDSARMKFGFEFIELYLPFTRLSGPMLGIECNRMDGQVSTMARACRQISPLLSDVERLDLIDVCDYLDMQETADEDPAFLELFHPFTAVRRLYVSKMMVPFVAPALDTREETTEVLPELRDLFLEGLEPSGSVQDTSNQSAIDQFVKARRRAGNPVAVHHWEWGRRRYSEV